ncbi:transposase [Denitratisoma sp. DHT3]|uniref:transposase n=1 Tax=Denitratisoma sp. DHT3 TaxID=1981880 RepID=UPI0021BD462C|nr:transposase [Denitratisoma sp. DHT3]
MNGQWKLFCLVHNIEKLAHHGYPPAMLLKVVLFAYSQGIVSSRGIERACREHITFMALSGDSAFHFTTIAAFISGLGEDIATLFAQILCLCDRQGLIGREMFAIDGVNCPVTPARPRAAPVPILHGTHHAQRRSHRRCAALSRSVRVDCRVGRRPHRVVQRPIAIPGVSSPSLRAGTIARRASSFQ